jgi:hypothetical protein
MVFNGPTPDAFNNYHPAGSPAATGGTSPAPTAQPPPPSTAHARRVRPSRRGS